MTSRERILATIRGDEVDRIPVWLKMGGGWLTSQPEAIRAMSELELLEATGCDLMLGVGLKHECKQPHVKTTSRKDNGHQVCTWETPDGTLTAEFRTDPVTGAGHPTKYPVTNLDELRIARWLFADTETVVKPEDAAASRKKQADLEALGAATCCGTGASPLMHMVEHLAGPENTVYMLYDDKTLFDETIQLMHESRVRHLEALLPHCAADTFWLTENTSTTLINPSMFEDYCMPHLTVYGNMILEQQKIPVHHMCGKINTLLERIDRLPAMANEAYTTPPVGDTLLAEGRSRMPSKALIGGTNATLLLEKPKTIIQAVAQDLENCPDRRKIFLTSAGVLPPAVDLDKARTIVDGLKAL